MQRVIKLAKASKLNNTKVYIIDGALTSLPKNLSRIKKLIQEKIQQDISVFSVLEDPIEIIIASTKVDINNKETHLKNESYRVLGAQVYQAIKTGLSSDVDIIFDRKTVKHSSYIIEGLLLCNYSFDQLKTNVRKVSYKKQTINALDSNLSPVEFKRLHILSESVNHCRDLINLPLSHLSAQNLSSRAKKMAASTDIKVTVLNKAKIQSLKMGGLLSVNLGSPDPPTFTIMEYKPKKSINERPIILVGKGVVYDTGGLSLKPTANSMDKMKIDMSGAAVVISSICAIAKLKLPYWVITLVPATDNRPGLNAYVPGDVITMHSGHSVEVLNTDAEGRLILADALHFAKKYNPELVIDYATLTGSAMRTLGKHGLTYMATADEKIKNRFEQAGQATHERYVNLPLWEEYGQYLKSDIADLKNVGGATAGAITAGKFLEHFTDYPWIHVDMAGSPYFNAADGYHPKNGTGIGVRSLVQFIKTYK